MMISAADMRSHLNIIDDLGDPVLDSKIVAASEWVSLYTAIPVDACDVPAPVKEAVRQLAAHLYENREATLIGVTAQSLPFGLLDLLMPYRAWVF